MYTPRYEYSRAKLMERIELLNSLRAPYGLTVRYAAKANSFAPIITILNEQGFHFDASSDFEARELIELGIPGAHISLASQQSPRDFAATLKSGVQYVATSLHQLDQFLKVEERPDTVSIRINPGFGQGASNRLTTGGQATSFGIWHSYLQECLDRTEAAGVAITRLHIHIGSGADPAVWGRVMDRALEIVRLLPAVTTLDIGGGYKVHRFGNQEEADIEAIMAVFSERLTEFAKTTGRQLRLEIEPGNYVVAHAGTLVATVDDIVDTGVGGYVFLKLNTGMNDFLGGSLYGDRHRIEVMNNAETQQSYVVVGHCCESGDIFTPQLNNSEVIDTVELNEAQIGDEVRMYDTGAYCASLRAKGYNSFPNAEEVMVD